MIKNCVVFIFILLFLTGCCKQKNYEEVTFSSWGSITEVGIIHKIISDFEKENPDIRIQFMHIPQNYFQKLHLLFVSNTPPDVIFINNIYLPLYVNELEDLSSIVDKKEFYNQSLNAMSIDNKLYAVPRDISNLVFYINSDILKISGIKTPDQNWTIDDLLEIAQKVTKDSVYGIGYEPDIYYALPYINYFGEDISSLDYQNSMGINFYKKLPKKVSPKRSDVGSSTIAQMFLDEKIALYLSGRWMYPKINECAKFNWYVMSFPYGRKGVPCDSSGWAISKKSKHKNAAIRFVKYISNETSGKYFAQTGLIVPANIEASKLLDNNKERVFLKVAEHSVVTPVIKDYKKITDKINKILEY